MTALVVVETAVLVVLCVLVAGLLQSYAAVLRRLDALDRGAAPALRTTPGVPAPVHRVEGRDEWGPGHDVSGTTLSGEVVQARVVQVEHDTVAAFLSSGCAGCTGFWEELSRPGSWHLPPGARLLVVAKDADAESAGLLAALCPPGVDLVLSSQAWTDYEVPGSPYVVVVDGATGRVRGEGSGTSFSQVMALVAQSGGDAGDADGAPRVRKPRSEAEREASVDDVLRAAGIAPGHASLYLPAESR